MARSSAQANFVPRNDQQLLLFKTLIMVFREINITVFSENNPVCISVSAMIVYIRFKILFIFRQCSFPVAEVISANCFSRQNLTQISFGWIPAHLSCFIFGDVILRKLMIFFNISNNLFFCRQLIDRFRLEYAEPEISELPYSILGFLEEISFLSAMKLL